ncbi:MAG: hypothetical protein QOG83_219 [Alphaproteobacteria bacterium]|jgi:hypothetical protein|nr:hypothetical protein [Alphaproteobacteria bacterium]
MVEYAQLNSPVARLRQNGAFPGWAAATWRAADSIMITAEATGVRMRRLPV